MNMRSAVLPIFLLGLLVGVSPVRGQIPPGFELIQITDDPDYDGPPSINNCGQVVFSKRIGNDFNHEEIFLWDNGTLIQITDDNHRDAFPQINDQGTIVWSRTTGGVDTHFEIARWSGGDIDILTNTPTLSEVAGEINNHGRMAWSRYIGGDCARNDLYFFDGAAEHQITDDIFSNQGGAINDFDEIAWTQYNFCVTPWWVGNIMWNGGDGTVQLTNEGTQLTSPDIGSDGTIVWGGANGIEQWKDGIRTLLVAQGSKPEINSSGAVAFNCHPGGVTQACLYVNGEASQLTEPPRTSFAASINDYGEVGIRSQANPTTFDSDIIVLRAISLSPDLDRSGIVELLDYAIWRHWLEGPSARKVRCENRRFDFDQNGAVDVRDFGRLQVLFFGT